MRVRAFTQDDGHIFCTEAQIQPEVKAFNELALRRPERPDHLIVVSIYNLIDRRFDL
jgi:hypothetical protein